MMVSIEPAMIGVAKAVEGSNIDHGAEMGAVPDAIKCHRCDRNSTIT